MKVWEAIELLKGMDHTSEVTLVFGKRTMPKPPSVTPLPAKHPVPVYQPTTQWVEHDGQNFWVDPVRITCYQPYLQ